jgi:L-amino acid N-acyltransferase YncA
VKVELKPIDAVGDEALKGAIESSKESLRRRFGDEIPVKGWAVIETRNKTVAGAGNVEDGRMTLWIRSDRQDRGLGKEAGELLLAQGFKKEGLHRLHARIEPANRAARKILQHLGFRYEGCLRQHARLNGRWIDQECWGLLKSEWKK